MTHFEWWDKVGSGMPPLAGEDQHEHVQRVTAACWDAARAAIYESEAAQLTAPLRERIASLHVAVCQAVSLLNSAPEVARCDEARQAHTILREVLVLHADEYMDAPAPEREREFVARKHRRA